MTQSPCRPVTLDTHTHTRTHTHTHTHTQDPGNNDVTGIQRPALGESQIDKTD